MGTNSYLGGNLIGTSCPFSKNASFPTRVCWPPQARVLIGSVVPDMNFLLRSPLKAVGRPTMDSPRLYLWAYLVWALDIITHKVHPCWLRLLMSFLSQQPAVHLLFSFQQIMQSLKDSRKAVGRQVYFYTHLPLSPTRKAFSFGLSFFCVLYGMGKIWLSKISSSKEHSFKKFICMCMSVFLHLFLCTTCL